MSRESSRNSHSASYVDEGAGDSDEETYVDAWLRESSAPAAPARAASQSVFLSPSSSTSRPQPQQSTHGKPTKQQPMLKCGWLQKRGEVSQQWKQKWVVLRRGSLEYHKDAESAQRGDIQGTILLAGVEIVRELPATGEFDPAQELAGRSFGLQLPPPNEHLLYPFRAGTLKERTAWLTMVERALKPVGASAASTPATATSTTSPIASASSASFASSTRWQHDELCYGCRKEFTITHRRHHCRRCGHAFCQPCSSKRYRLPGSEQAVRVCDDCMSILHAPPPRVKTAEEKKEESEARLRAQRAQQAETDRLAAAAAAASAATAAAAAAAILGATALNNSARKPGAGAGSRKNTADSWDAPAGRGGTGRSESVSVNSSATHRVRTTRPEKARALYAPPPPAPSAAAAAASAAAGSSIAMRAVGPSAASSAPLHSATGAPAGRSHPAPRSKLSSSAGDSYVAFNDSGAPFDDIRHDSESDSDDDEDGSRRRKGGMCACLG